MARRNALTIARNVAASVGFEIPDTLTASSDPNTQKLRTLLNRSGSILAKKRGPFGESWPELTREHTIQFVAGKDIYSLPAGFNNLINNTVWDRSVNEPAPGPLTPQEWQTLKGGLVDTVALSPRYRLGIDPATNLQGIRIDPVPAGEGSITFEYISGHWVSPTGSNVPTADTITHDSDVPIYSADLVELDLEWRIRKATGQEFSTDLAEFEMERDRTFSQKVGLRTVRLAPRFVSIYDLNIPESGFGGVR